MSKKRGSFVKGQPVLFALVVLVGFVVGTILLGALEGNDFSGNLSYGLMTGLVAAVVALVFAVGWRLTSRAR